MTLGRLIDQPAISDSQGNLTFVEGGRHVPFNNAHIYYLYNAFVEAEQSGHAHRKLCQAIFSLSDSASLKFDHKRERREICRRGLRKGVAAESTGWQGMDTAFHPHHEEDHLRDRAASLFAAEKRCGRVLSATLGYRVPA